jgi:predicted transcriptional regulator
VDARRGSVSEAELEVLKVLWEHGPATVRAVQTVLAGQGRGWKYTTVQTLLARLEAKGYVRGERGGPAHVFAAAVSREGLLSERLRDLADQLCDGAASPLVQALLGEGRLTPQEVAELRQMLDRLGPAVEEERRLGKRPRGG